MIEPRPHTTAWYRAKTIELLKKRDEIAHIIEPSIAKNINGVVTFENANQFILYKLHYSMTLNYTFPWDAPRLKITIP